MNCPKCNAKSYYKLKLIPTNRKNVSYFPKYIPQIAEWCTSDHFIRFAPQTQELIDALNALLRIIKLKEKDLPKILEKITEGIQLPLDPNSDIPEKEVLTYAR